MEWGLWDERVVVRRVGCGGEGVESVARAVEQDVAPGGRRDR